MRKGTPYQPRNFLFVNEQTNPIPMEERFTWFSNPIRETQIMLLNTRELAGGACALLAVLAHCDRSATLDRI